MPPEVAYQLDEAQKKISDVLQVPLRFCSLPKILVALNARGYLTHQLFFGDVHEAFLFQIATPGYGVVRHEHAQINWRLLKRDGEDAVLTDQYEEVQFAIAQLL